MTYTSPYENCPLANVCQQTTDSSVPCGESPLHLPALPLAEKLCLEAVEGALRLEESELGTPPYPGAEAERHYRIGCLYLERSLHPNVSPGQAETFLDKSDDHLRRAIEHPGARVHVTTSAGLTQAELPFMWHRKNEEEVPDDTLLRARSEIATIGEKLNALDLQVDPRKGHLLRIGTQLLILRDGTIAYFPTYRELGQARDNLSKEELLCGHNAYFIDDDEKLPLSVTLKPARGKDEAVGRISLGQVVAKSVDDVMPELNEVYDRSDLTIHAIEWAIKEAGGGKLKPRQIDILDAVTENFLDRVEALFPPHANYE